MLLQQSILDKDLLLTNRNDICLFRKESNSPFKRGKFFHEIFQIIEIYSNDSVSFYEFVEDINSNFNKEQKLALIKLLWETAYADNVLEVNEERLIRRVADLIRIKSSLVLKLKEEVRTN